MNSPQIESSINAQPKKPAPQKRGPKTAEGKARSSRNALKHGLRAKRFQLVEHEDLEEFRAFSGAIVERYGPSDLVEQHFVDGIAIAMWRQIRADRIEADVLDSFPQDGMRFRGAGQFIEKEHCVSLTTALRYRAQAQMELRRAIALLEDYRHAKQDFPDGPHANQNDTNDFYTPESQTSPGLEPRFELPQGSGDLVNPRENLSSCTNDLTARLQATVFHGQEPFPSLLNGPYRE